MQRIKCFFGFHDWELTETAPIYNFPNQDYVVFGKNYWYSCNCCKEKKHTQIIDRVW